MREFELLANEEQIRAMAREFASVRVRGELLNKAAMPRQRTTIASDETAITQKQSDVSAVSNAEKTNDVSNVINVPTPQTPSEACHDIERVYRLERESEQMALRLYSLAPTTQKDEIAEIIRIKRVNLERLDSEYERVANKELVCSICEYSGYEYCETLLCLSQSQARLLACLARHQDCAPLKDITNSEIIVATALNRLAIFR